MEFNDNKSIYLQIADNISEKIINGSFPPEERIPSVRELAGEMGVNPNTVMRTYAELQSMNIIENKRGVGYFVHPEAKKVIIDQKRKDFFNQVLPELIHQAKLLGITAKELKNEFEKIK